MIVHGWINRTGASGIGTGTGTSRIFKPQSVSHKAVGQNTYPKHETQMWSYRTRMQCMVLKPISWTFSGRFERIRQHTHRPWLRHKEIENVAIYHTCRYVCGNQQEIHDRYLRSCKYCQSMQYVWPSFMVTWVYNKYLRQQSKYALTVLCLHWKNLGRTGLCCCSTHCSTFRIS